MKGGGRGLHRIREGKRGNRRSWEERRGVGGGWRGRGWWEEAASVTTVGEEETRSGLCGGCQGNVVEVGSVD